MRSILFAILMVHSGGMLLRRSVLSYMLSYMLCVVAIFMMLYSMVGLNSMVLRGGGLFRAFLGSSMMDSDSMMLFTMLFYSLLCGSMMGQGSVVMS
jgi:hypothetical protein